MCGRYLRRSPVDDIAQLFDSQSQTADVAALTPSFNVAPTQQVLVARLDERGQRQLTLLRWGLVPAWSQGPDNRYSMINARAESVASKPAYRSAFKARRCLIAADGFYEWQKTPQNNVKQPFCIGLAGAKPFAFAGLWERWQSKDDGDGRVIESCTIITTEANAVVSAIHDRMPVILAPEGYATWLDHDQTPQALLRPFPAELMDAYPVSTRVNSPRNNDAELLAPLNSR